MTTRTLRGRALVNGRASGPVLFADLGLSFMGGVDPVTGIVIDTHHPLRGTSVAGTVLAIPSGRGSCSGSLVIFELLLNGHAPRALVFHHKETILTLGVVIAEELFGRGIPVLSVNDADFVQLADARFASIDGATLVVSDHAPADAASGAATQVDLGAVDVAGFDLSDRDLRMLAGEFGDAAAMALRIVIRTASLEGSTELVDVEMAHLDGCFYHGPASLKFAHRMLAAGARVSVPTTTNAICVDRRRWRDLGVDEEFANASAELAASYEAMGARPTFTCAPYLLEGAPTFGQQIAWGESNAVVFANAVLGARTLKYPDYLDLLVAVTGRAPSIDCHTLDARRAIVRVDVPTPDQPDDAYFAMLGYHVGKIATNDIPVVCGLERAPVTRDDLKGFGAAFATTSAVAMYHMHGITPEARRPGDLGDPERVERTVVVTNEDLLATWQEMSNARSPEVDLISLGNPHFSLGECAALAELVADRTKLDRVEMLITCGQDIYRQAVDAGHVATIEAFGGTFLTDACWCFITEPVIPANARIIATNSGKYAHYGPAAVSQQFHFASLARCVDAACTGRIDTLPPAWLTTMV